ncbi:MAG: hypothetical protein KF749_13040, partial [Bacteroidetes bacterium]|nr:hypothetical protein [Bacteroidota bacterium]
MPNKLHKFVTITAFWCVAVAANAQTANPDSALQIILSQTEGKHLHLREAVEYALTNATSVKTAEAAYMSARGAARRQAGAFDPELFFTLNHMDREEPTASFFAGAAVLATTQTTGNAGIRYETPIGTRLEVSMNAVRLN